MSNEVALHRIIVGAMDGQDQAVDELFAYVQEYVDKADLSQLGRYSDDAEYRTEIAVRALGRLLARRCRRLRRYLDEPELRFATLLCVVVARVVAELVRSASKVARARIEHEQAWLDAALGEPVDRLLQAQVSSTLARARLDLDHFLSRTADPTDIKLARLAQSKSAVWSSAARGCQMTEESARARVRRVHDGVRAVLYSRGDWPVM